MNQDAFRALLDLLPQVFPSPAALGAWLPANVPDGDRIVNNLPNSTVAPAQYFYAAADILRRWGLLGVPEFWDPLEDEAPKALKPSVADLRARCGVPPGRAKPSLPNASPPPATITVVLVSASPENAVRIRVDEEFRDIMTKVRSTPASERIRFEQVNATRFEDLRTALLRYKPHVLHISSHGEEDGSLRLEARDASGSQLVSKRRLIGLFTQLNDNLRLVVINACHSKAIARDIPPEIDLAIGMDREVNDRASIDFSVSFYETLGYGKPVEKAFKVALASLEDGDEEVPLLFPNSGEDSEGKRKLILIKG